LTPTHADLKPKLTLVPGVDPAKTEASAAPPSPPAQPAEAAKSEAAVVRLRLNVCLRNLPAFQLSGELPEISDDILIELPYSVIEPQLASGRIAIEAKVFHGAIPEKFRNLFVVDATETPVLLPLQEVLQHLPTTALKMRHDQEQEEAIEHFETPFSLHAKEDQKRFGKPTSDAGKTPEPPATPELPVAAPTETPQAEAAPVEKAEEKAPAIAAEPEKPAAIEAEKKTVGTEAESKAGSADHQPASPPPATTENQPATSAENTVAAAEAKSNAKEFVLRVSCLPGVAGCSIAFADGLTMAGNLPPGLGADGLCAVAPSVLQKLEKHMLETDLGPLNAMTLHCTKSPLSFFMQGNVCLTVLHAERTLELVTQEQLVEMTKELAQIFAQPETTHVDH
jgi:predicted regulator of Ras-like GTPase activity (Roadblock/LC7/MglB family)